MKLKIILLIALSLAGVTQAYAKSHKSKHAHHRGHQWVFPSKSMCERYGGMWNQYSKDCLVYDLRKGVKMCRALGGRFPSLNEFRRVIVGCGGRLVRIVQRRPYNASKIGYPYTSCLERVGLSHIGSHNYLSSSINRSIPGSIILVNPAVGVFDTDDAKSTDGYVSCIR